MDVQITTIGKKTGIRQKSFSNPHDTASYLIHWKDEIELSELIVNGNVCDMMGLLLIFALTTSAKNPYSEIVNIIKMVGGESSVSQDELALDWDRALGGDVFASSPPITIIREENVINFPTRIS